MNQQQLFAEEVRFGRFAAANDPGEPPPAERFQPFASSKELTRIALYVGLMLCDLLAVLSSFAIAGLVRFGTVANPGVSEVLTLLVPVFGAAGLISSAYSLEALGSTRRSILLALRPLLIGLGAVSLVMFYLKTGESFSRLFVAMGSCLALAAVPTSRFIYTQIVRRRLHDCFVNEIVFIDDVDAPVRAGQRKVFAADAGLEPSLADPALLDRFAQLTLNCDRVIVSCSPERRPLWSSMMKACGSNVEILVPEIDSLRPLSLRQSQSHTSLQVSSAPLGVRNRLLKRALDLAICVPALIVLAPIFLACAVAVAIESNGPILFVQRRVGRGNRAFSIYKFRSMSVGRLDAGGERSAARDDDRVTRVGRFLRRTSLDELPQLFNVLKGDMSLVGPRPHALLSRAEDLLFWEIDQLYWNRHGVKPGITGLAQVRGFRGATSKRVDLTDRLQADLEYLNGWHVGRDILILLRTFSVVVHANAF